MSYAFSIAIPTYNNGHLLERLVDRLRNQDGIAGLEWEILIVDNNSTDGSSEVIQELVERHAGTSPHLRSVCETNQGAAYARIRAVQECQSEFIAFIDDDINPNSNWIADGLAIIRSQPKVAVVAGKTLLGKSITPFPKFESVARLFAIEDFGDEAFTYRARENHLPPSAAVWVRREAWVQNITGKPILRGACKGFPFSGDDNEAFLRIAFGGWKLRYEPTLVTHHELDPKRFEKPGLKRLAKLIGHATYPARLLESPSRLRATQIALRMMARGTLVWIKHNRNYGWCNQEPAAYMLKQHSIGFATAPFVYAYFRLRGKI